MRLTVRLHEAGVVSVFIQETASMLNSLGLYLDGLVRLDIHWP